MPLNTTEIKQALTTIANTAARGVSTAMGGAPPPGGPQGVFDVSNDGLTWRPTVRVRAGSGTSFSVVDGEATVTAAALGEAEYATRAIFRASPPPADGAIFRIVSPPGEYRYSTSSGAGWADDDDTILKPDSILVGANGRAFSTRASEHAATFAAARAMKGILGRAKHVHIESHTTFGDGGGGVFDVKDNSGSTYTDDDGIYIEAGDAALVRRGADSYHVKAQWFGVYSGRADNVLNINAAIAFLDDGGTLDLRGRGTIDVSDFVDLRDRQFITVLGSNSTIRTKAASNFTGKAVLNAFGTSYLVLNDVRVYSTITANLPACGLAIGRTATHQGGAVTINGGYYYGRYTGAPLYNMCAENSAYNNANFEGVECPAMIDASDDPLSLSGGGYFVSNFGKKINNCTLGSTGAGSTAICKFQGRTYSVSIDGGFIHSDDTAVDGFLFELGAVSADPVNDQAVGVRMNNIRGEQASGWRVAHFTKNASDVHFDNPSTSSDGAALVEASGTNGKLLYSTIRAPRIGGAGCPVLKVNGSGGTVTYCDILVGAANMVEVTAGAVTVCNIRSLNGYPMTGAAWSETADYGNTISVQAYSGGGKSYTENGARRRFWKTIVGATPDVGGWELFKIDQSGATDVTNFTNGHSGQRITVRAVDGLSTFKHGATIQNKIGADVTLATGATIEYALDGSVWVEI